jgi:hypothetical protein
MKDHLEEKIAFIPDHLRAIGGEVHAELENYFSKYRCILAVNHDLSTSGFCHNIIICRSWPTQETSEGRPASRTVLLRDTNELGNKLCVSLQADGISVFYIWEGIQRLATIDYCDPDFITQLKQIAEKFFTSSKEELLREGKHVLRELSGDDE